MDGREEGVWSGYGGHSPRGLDARIRRAIQRLQSYLNNEVPKLDELEVPILPYDDFHQDKGFVRQLPTNGRLLRRLQPSIQPSGVRARKGSIFMQMLIGNPDFLCFLQEIYRLLYTPIICRILPIMWQFTVGPIRSKLIM